MMLATSEQSVCGTCGTMLGGVVTSLPGGVVAMDGYASRRQRLGGFVVDYIVQWAGSYAIFFTIGMFIFMLDAHPHITRVETAIFAIGLALIYYVAFEASPLQGTPGKLLLGTKVVNSNGNRISLGQALLRFIGRFPAGVLLASGYLIILIDPRRQGMHDKIASTFVTRR